MALLVSLYLVAGLVTVGVAIPMMRRQVPPNRWYGFRTRRTLRDRALWYDANEYAGRMLVRAGSTIVACALGTLPIALISLGAYSFVCLFVTLGALVSSTVASFRYLSGRSRAG
jgi:uncharacterized membrane protein